LTRANEGLTRALGQLEARCKLLEEKQARLKYYKKMVDASMFMICAHCQKTVATNIFGEHIEGCRGQEKISKTNNETVNAETERLRISIDQAQITQNEGKKQVTKFLVSLRLGTKNWQVGRRFKEFAALDQFLRQKCPQLTFPDSSSQLFRSTNQPFLFSSKRRTA
jgi:hypothetical protein